ncbi:MAG: hypothetical protein Q8K71_17500 [Polaromonas sp.]|nr:hypothetical protein [Polaromonas sp.]MDP3752133.1 hypothetical protein [Polaromonas sp.]
MTWRMVASPFEFAPHAARYHPLGWALLLAGVSALLAGAAATWDANNRVDATRAQQNRALQSQKASQEQSRREAKDPQAVEKLKAQRQLESLLQTPWSLLLDALEASADAVEGRVALLSMSPSTASRKVELSLVATNYPSMLAYAEAMKDVSGFSNVKISSHQIDERLGPAAVRFKARASWNDLKEGVFLLQALPPGANLTSALPNSATLTKPADPRTSLQAPPAIKARTP